MNYNGVGIRIDGGPAAADMDRFMGDLEASLSRTLADDAKRERFVSALLSAGSYRSETAVVEDLNTYILQLGSCNFFNESHVDGTAVPYGYARLDAFGRIYNRVLEHVLDPAALRAAVDGVLSPDEADAMLGSLPDVLSAEDRKGIIQKLMSLEDEADLRQLRDIVFNSPNAPVSYPFLWDIPQHDYVQWNGIGGNAGVGPIGRNAGEVIGVFGTLDWVEKPGWSFASVVTGHGFESKHVSFTSSVDVQNLRKIEDRLWSLTSPSWAEAAQRELLPSLDTARMARGAELYTEHCEACHAVIDSRDPDRRIVARMDRLGVAGTDRRMANNSVQYDGFSGILRNQYVTLDAGSLLLQAEAPVAALLTKATQSVVATPDPDKWFFTRFADWALTLAKAFASNEIKPSLKAGSYTPDTPVRPLNSLLAYKGRPLNGIWATAPYLHNGSVPTLYDLLLPATARENDPDDMAYRPQTFMVGSRELDVEKVGFKHGVSEYDGFLFDTTTPSNSNGGHDYGTRMLTPDERMDLVEFLKSL